MGWDGIPDSDHSTFTTLYKGPNGENMESMRKKINGILIDDDTLGGATPSTTQGAVQTSIIAYITNLMQATLPF